VRVIQILAFFFLERFRVGDPESNNTPPLIQLVAFFPRAISQSTGNLGSFFSAGARGCLAEGSFRLLGCAPPR
jgi:hypothetical protein